MQIIVDADACPRAIKEILYRACEKEKIALTLVANTHIRTPSSPLFRSIQVAKSVDEADDRIVELVVPGDLVVTADIPLADRVVKKGALALDPRGRLYSEETIGQYVSMRDFMQELRSGGVETGGPPPLGVRDRQNFSNQLQTWFQKCIE